MVYERNLYIKLDKWPDDDEIKLVEILSKKIWNDSLSLSQLTQNKIKKTGRSNNESNY